MQIKKNHVVSLNYRLTENNLEGELIEETYSSEPLKFIFGVGMMLPSFEENLENKVATDGFAFILKPEDAYGTFEKEAVVDIPLQSFTDENGNVDQEKLAVGNPLQMSDQDGRTFHGIVLENKPESIKIDFNHPMAGKTLHFKGEILEVRDATDSELDHGHVH